MKKGILLVILLFSLFSCSTGYYNAELEAPATLYSNSDGSDVVTSIPNNSKIILYKQKKNDYTKIKWGNYLGWAYKPSYKLIDSIKTQTTTETYQSKSYDYAPSSYKSSGGSVHVKGYYRKDGTYVRPHTRHSRRR